MKETHAFTVTIDHSAHTIIEAFGLSDGDMLKLFLQMKKETARAAASGNETMTGLILSMLRAKKITPEHIFAVGIGDILNTIEGIDKAVHDCETCPAYDSCDLPLKKPRNGSASRN